MRTACEQLESRLLLSADVLGGAQDVVAAEPTTEATYIIPGDANLDGVVDMGDLAIYLANAGQAGAWAQADFSDDGLVDIVDFTILKAHFGERLPAPSDPTPVVVEPTPTPPDPTPVVDDPTPTPPDPAPVVPGSGDGSTQDGQGHGDPYHGKDADDHSDGDAQHGKDDVDRYPGGPNNPNNAGITNGKGNEASTPVSQVVSAPLNVASSVPRAPADLSIVAGAESLGTLAPGDPFRGNDALAHSPAGASQGRDAVDSLPQPQPVSGDASNVMSPGAPCQLPAPDLNAPSPKMAGNAERPHSPAMPQPQKAQSNQLGLLEVPNPQALPDAVLTLGRKRVG